MDFHEAFSNLVINEELERAFNDISVEKVIVSKRSGKITIIVSGITPVRRGHIVSMQDVLMKQIFTSREQTVFIEERYDLSCHLRSTTKIIKTKYSFALFPYSVDITEIEKNNSKYLSLSEYNGENSHDYTNTILYIAAAISAMFGIFEIVYIRVLLKENKIK